VKVLSLRQPWSAIVLFHEKRIENRRWNTSFRGPFLIHAAKAMTRREFDEALMFSREVLADKCPSEAELRSQLQFGGIVGRARLVEVVPPQRNLPLLADYYPPGIDRRWHMLEQFGFILADVEPLPFVPCVGHLGFFEVPAEVA
jgi:hypothetical protein